MNTKLFNNLIITLMLILLVVSAFFMRLDNVKRSQIWTIDEMVYYRMAQQVNKDALDYNTIPYGQELSKKGRPLPKYFFEPLFKHPPVFTYLVALSIRIFGDNLASASYVPLAMSALMIPLIFLLGASVYNRSVGLMAAFFLWLDPINIICSQKVWMDTPIAFFTLLAAVFFSFGLRKNQGWFYILSGIASGLAVNTKYTGIFITFTILIFVLIYRRDLFKSKMFRISLVLPFLMLIPWVLWNLSVYNISAIKQQSEIKRVYELFSGDLSFILIIIIAVAALFLLLKKIRNDLIKPQAKNVVDKDEAGNGGLLRPFSIGVVILFFAVFINRHFINSFILDYLPNVSWQQGIFAGALPSFYFSRLMEFFIIYAFAFISLFLYQPKEEEQNSFIRISAIFILLFFIAWGNYQSRYILSATPFLLLLASSMICRIYDSSLSLKVKVFRQPLKYFIIFIVIYSVVRVCFVNLFLSYTNNMCYF